MLGTCRRLTDVQRICDRLRDAAAWWWSNSAGGRAGSRRLRPSATDAVLTPSRVSNSDIAGPAGSRASNARWSPNVRSCSTSWQEFVAGDRRALAGLGSEYPPVEEGAEDHEHVHRAALRPPIVRASRVVQVDRPQPRRGNRGLFKPPKREVRNDWRDPRVAGHGWTCGSDVPAGRTACGRVAGMSCAGSVWSA